MLNWSCEQKEHSVAIKMPSGPVFSADYEVKSDFSTYTYQITKEGRDVAILALGTFYTIGIELYEKLKEKGINATLINPSFANGLDTTTLDKLAQNHNTVVTLEDGVLDGGFGQRIASYFGKSNVRVYSYGFKREFVDRYNVNELLKANRLTPEQIACDIL